MKKSILVLAMAFCGTFAFAQNSIERVDIIQKKAVGAKMAKASPEADAKSAPSNGISIIEKKQMKSATKTNLPLLNAVEPKAATGVQSNSVNK